MNSTVDTLKEAIALIPFTPDGNEIAGDLIALTNKIISSIVSV